MYMNVTVILCSYLQLHSCK